MPLIGYELTEFLGLLLAEAVHYRSENRHLLYTCIYDESNDYTV